MSTATLTPTLTPIPTRAGAPACLHCQRNDVVRVYGPGDRIHQAAPADLLAMLARMPAGDYLCQRWRPTARGGWSVLPWRSCFAIVAPGGTVTIEPAD